MNELTTCPFCNGDYIIREVECRSCHTTIKGKFRGNRFQLFSKEQLYFIELFLKNEGNIKGVEKDLGISYPTVKNKLHEINKILGYISEEVADTVKVDILKELKEGKIDVTQALKDLEEI